MSAVMTKVNINPNKSYFISPIVGLPTQLVANIKPIDDTKPFQLTIDIDDTSIKYTSVKSGKMLRLIYSVLNSHRYIPIVGPTLEPIDSIELRKRFANTKARYNIATSNISAITLTII